MGERVCPATSGKFVHIARQFHASVIALFLMLAAGCSTDSEQTDNNIRVQAGMSRDDLKLYFGSPLRVEPAATGGENWYYRFSSWNADPEESSGINTDGGTITHYDSKSVTFSKSTDVYPVHLSPLGLVVAPVPDGKIVRN
jgi:outer membrane protein assembly factor BamE (lipoprotein component of BamABCDE complex)